MHSHNFNMMIIVVSSLHVHLELETQLVSLKNNLLTLKSIVKKEVKFSDSNIVYSFRDGYVCEIVVKKTDAYKVYGYKSNDTIIRHRHNHPLTNLSRPSRVGYSYINGKRFVLLEVYD